MNTLGKVLRLTDINVNCSMFKLHCYQIHFVIMSDNRANLGGYMFIHRPFCIRVRYMNRLQLQFGELGMSFAQNMEKTSKELSRRFVQWWYFHIT